MNIENEERYSFRGYVIVSCGTLRHELNFLKEDGFLNADKILYTSPGLHENPKELERQLKLQINNAEKYSDKIIVIYGSRCYIDVNTPSRNIDDLIQKSDSNIVRINAKNCIDMLASDEERKEISKGEKVYWLSPGWIENWEWIFKNWDIGKANETFPQNKKAILLDGVNFFAEYLEKYPEKILKFSDWLKLEIEPYKVSLSRFKKLLREAESRFSI